MDYIAQFLSANPTVAGIYWAAAVILVLVDLFLIYIFILSSMKLLEYRPKFVRDPRKLSRIKKKSSKPLAKMPVVTAEWSRVQAKMKEGTSESMRLAVLEADGVIDEVMKRMALRGDTFAERLGHVNPNRYATIDKVWSAHRLRNNLMHAHEFHLAAPEAEAAIANYEAFLKEAKAL